MTAVASETWGLVFWVEEGRAHASVVGPEDRTSTAPVPRDAEFVGVQFAVGTSLRMAATPSLVNGAITLPDVDSGSFWLDGRRWQTPTADDAEVFVERLVRHEVIGFDPEVAAVLRGGRSQLSHRSLQRRFRAASGMTRGAVRQITRARTAAQMLVAGADVGEVAANLGYCDEPHLARSLRRFIGRSAGQLRAGTHGVIALDTAQNSTS